MGDCRWGEAKKRSRVRARTDGQLILIAGSRQIAAADDRGYNKEWQSSFLLITWPNFGRRNCAADALLRSYIPRRSIRNWNTLHKLSSAKMENCFNYARSSVRNTAIAAKPRTT